MVYNTDTTERQLQDYLALRKSEGQKPKTLQTAAAAVRSLLRYCDEAGKGLDDLRQDDITDWVNTLRDRLAPGSVNTYMVQARNFMSWYITGTPARPFPEVVAHLKVSRKIVPRVQEHASVHSDLYVRLMEEARKVNGDLPVFIAMLFDTGARQGELLPVQQKHIILNGGSTYLEVRGKTGYRRVPLAGSLPILKAHLQKMPSDPEAYLFPGRFGGCRGRNYFAKPLRAIVVRLKEEDLVPRDQKLSSHTFRHTRATAYGTTAGWSNPMLETLFGWKPGSVMPSLYIHPSDGDMATAVAVAQGLEKPKEQSPDEVQSCPNCEQPIPLAMKFCGQCGHAMQSEVQAEVDQVKGLVSELGAEMVEKLIQQGMAMEQFINSTEYQAIRQQFKVEAI